MACDLATVLANACTSGIGKETDPVKLLRLTAQSAADWAESVAPSVDYSLDAIMDRACTSGVGMVYDKTTLLQIIAQNVCSTIP